MRSWLPSDVVADLAGYRGPVRRVERIGATYLGEPSWAADVEIGLSGDDQPLILPFILTASSLHGEPPPEPGEAIEGKAWVQGRLI